MKLTLPALTLAAFSATQLAAGCPAKKEDPTWVLAACEFSNDSAEFDKSVDRARRVIGIGPLDASSGLLALSQFGPMVLVPDVETGMRAPVELSRLLLKAGVDDLTPQEEETLNDIGFSVMMEDGLANTSALYDWLDEVSEPRGLRAIFVDFGGGSTGIAVVPEGVFCRWVNVRFENNIGFVGTWRDAEGPGLSDKVKWEDAPRNGCVKAAT